MKQEQNETESGTLENRLVIAKAGGEGWIENLGLANNIYNMDKQQGPTV